jgi:hypothetical protein
VLFKWKTEHQILTKRELADWSTIHWANRLTETSVPSNTCSTTFWTTIILQQTTSTYTCAVNADRFYAKTMRIITLTVLNWNAFLLHLLMVLLHKKLMQSGFLSPKAGGLPD